ncbi:hypothetical protein CEXT_626371 [Caerostris extrusa]|uniref:Uncharacterized protein n=1 Tax=Caerostris extrusa TaxID=172846 RepID=A0AAV4W741_CAEEX|nr:hypothetical protein CEXT_626371 [Caerostris extrusa]
MKNPSKSVSQSQQKKYLCGMDRCSRKKSFADSRPSESIGGLAGSSKFEEGKEYRKRFPTRNKDKLQSKPAVVLAPILPAMFTVK